MRTCASTGLLPPAQQDQIVDECVKSKVFYVNCPYIHELHELARDVPLLMLGKDAMRDETEQVSLRDRATAELMGYTHQMG